MTTNWTELPANPSGNASCENLLVRGTLFASAIVGTLVPVVPLILTDTRTVGTPTLGALAIDGVSSPLTGATRITMRSNNLGSDSSVIRWLRSDNALRWSMGTDVNGVGNNNFWLFDNALAIYGLYFQSGAVGDTVGSIRWQGGRVAYDTSTDTMTRRIANVIRETFSPATWTLASPGSVILSSATGMALTGTAGVNIQSGDSATLQAANNTNVIAAGALLLQSGAAGFSLVSAGPGSVDAATDLDVNASDTLTLTGAGATPGVVIEATASDVQIKSVTGVKLDPAASGGVGIYGGGPVGQGNITGSRIDLSATGALGQLLTYLASRGDILDNSTP